MVSVTASQVLDTAEMPPQIHFWRHSIFLRSNIGLRSPLIILSGHSAGKESTYNAEDLGSNPGSRRSPGERNGYTNSSILAGKVPWTDQAGRLRKSQGQHNCVTMHTHTILSNFLRSTRQTKMLSRHLPSLEITSASCSDCTSLLSWLHPRFCSQVVPLMNVLYV